MLHRRARTERTVAIRAESLESRTLLAAPPTGPYLSEFLATNGGGLRDADGDRSDWIEIRKPAGSPASLVGYGLTDDRTRPLKWTFPAVTLQPGQSVLVFASGKDRRDPARELHTNFKLDGDGEYLALVAPGGTAADVVTQFDPYPPQVVDVSYGLDVSEDVTPLVGPDADARLLVPTADAPADWPARDFDDSGWAASRGGIGYDFSTAPERVPGFTMRMIDVAPSGADATVDDLSEAIALLDGTADLSRYVILSDSRADYPTAAANFNTRLPNGVTSADPRGQNIAMRFTADVSIPAGDWTVGVFGDGFRLRLPGVRFISRTGENLTGAADLAGDDTLIFAPTTAGGAATATFSVPAGGVTTRLTLEGFQTYLNLNVGAGHTTTMPRTPLADGALGWSAMTTSSTPPVDLRPAFGTDLGAAMRGNTASAYLRLPFEVESSSSPPDLLRLRVRYDDGFVAYLNGAEVARRDVPAMGSRPDAQALVPETFTLPAALLAPGKNVLAIHGLNDAAYSPDFFVAAELEAVKATAAQRQYFIPPTPGAHNGPSDLTDVVADTRFSVDRSLLDSPVDVAITTATPGATIRYTLDGTPPTATHGLVYDAPLHVPSTTVLRAAAFKENSVPSNVDTQTYVFVSDVLHQDDTPPPGAPPVGAGGVTWDYAMNPIVVDDPAYHDRVAEGLKAFPTLSLVMDPQDLFGPLGVYSNSWAEGADWERPGSAELIYPDGTREGFQIDAGVRLHGNQSRIASMPKHSLRLAFRGRYGDGSLKFPLFADAPFGDTAADQFDTLVLRAGFNDSFLQFGPRAQYVRDQFFSDLQLAMGQPSKHGTFVQLYVNGKYWGLYNPVERPDASFAATYLGGDEDDYDAIAAGGGFDSAQAVSGDLTAWKELRRFAALVPTDPQAYEQVKQLLDVDGFIDYLLINYYGGNFDWPGGNWYAARKRESEAKFHFFSWDAESTLYQNPRAAAAGASPGDLFSKLKTNPEFRLAVADRAQLHLVNPGGALTAAAARARYRQLTDWVQPGIVPESARWGDWIPDPIIGDGTFATERDAVVGRYLAQQAAALLQNLKSNGFYPAVDGPAFNQQGGLVSPGFAFTLSKTAGQTGDIYYTLDGSDPRLPGGAISPAAIRYVGPVALDRSRTIKARVLRGTTWSAANVATFSFDLSALRVTELMYHPADPPPGSNFTEASDFEFLEVQNTSSASMYLGGVRFTQGVRFTFGDVTLKPGQWAVVVRNVDAFRSRYGDDVIGTVAGTYDGALDNSGERLRMEGPGGQVLIDLLYDDAWLPETDGAGKSLVIVNPAAPAPTWGEATSWRASTTSGGAPGGADLAPGVAASVAARHVFYNRSAADGGDTAADPRDDAAVAPDKLALLPGASGTFANVTGYTRGLNGIMIDVDGLPAAPTPDDFSFAVASPGGTGWVDAPAPLAVRRRVGAGDRGSDRVTITWPDGAIRNTWLRVTVKATGRTGLAAPDVFYFGNLAGETGDATSPFRVGALDLAGVKQRLNASPDPAGPYDVNRDGRVNALDLAAVRQNLNRTLSPPPAAAPEAAREALLFPAPPVSSRLLAARVWDELEPGVLE